MPKITYAKRAKPTVKVRNFHSQIEDITLTVDEHGKIHISQGTDTVRIPLNRTSDTIEALTALAAQAVEVLCG